MSQPDANELAAKLGHVLLGIEPNQGYGKKVEYMYISLSDVWDGEHGVIAEFNRLGQEGWRLITVIERYTSVMAIFGREIG